MDPMNITKTRRFRIIRKIAWHQGATEHGEETFPISISYPLSTSVYALRLVCLPDQLQDTLAVATVKNAQTFPAPSLVALPSD